MARGCSRGWLAVSAVCALLALGCSGNGDADPPVAAGTGGNSSDGGAQNGRECIDNDDDGAGRNCDIRDCDDDDPTVTDECIRCADPNEGCPCDPGTRPEYCRPPDIEVDGGVLQCSEGTRYCREHAEGVMLWSDCEIIGEYTFVSNDDL